MGWFNTTKTVINVSSQSINLMPESPNITRDSVTSAVLDNRPITEEIVVAENNSLVLRTRNAIRYAKDHYTYGLPEGDEEIGLLNTAAVKAVIETEVGSDIQILSAVLDQPYPEFLVRSFLVTTRGWDITTGIVSTPPFTPPVGSSDVVLSSSEFIANVADTVRVTYYYTYDDGSTVTAYYVTEDVPVVSLELSNTYYQVTYQTVDALDVPTSGLLFWYYDESAGTHPTLTLSDSVSLESPYYPIIPIREHNQDLTREDLRETELFKTSEKLLSYMGLGIIDIGDVINSNPDIGQIDHAYIYMGVDLFAEEPSAIEYLHDYFAYLGNRSTYTLTDFNNWFAGTQENPPPLNVISIADANVNIHIGYRYIEISTVTGNIGKVGTATRTANITSPSVNETDTGETTIFNYEYETSSVTFRKQVSATTYTEVTVHGLMHTNSVYRGHLVETTIALASDPENNNFVLPLNRFLVGTLSLQKETKLMYSSIKLLINSYDITKVKWYQSRLFAFILLIVAIVITVMTFGADGGYTLNTAAVYAADIATLTATQLLILSIVFDLIWMYMIGQVGKLLVKELGLENSFIGAVLLAAIAVYQIYQGDTAAFGEMFTAANLLMAVNGITYGISQSVKEDMEDLLAEKDAFLSAYKEDMDVLAEITKDLDGSDAIDPFSFIEVGKYFNPDETPEEFYTRTIHSGNVGVLAFDQLHEYFDTKLKLPETNSTIGFNPIGVF